MTTPLTPEPNNDTQAPGEVKGHILTSDQLNGWGNTDVFVGPGVTDEEGNVHTPNQDEPETPEVPEDEEELPEPEVLDNTVTVEDPGDYTPADYSFEVTIYSGEEGKEKPKTVKVTSIEQAEELLEQDPNFGNAKNLLDFNRKVTKMENNLERDKAAYESQKAEYDTATEGEQQRQERITTIANELKYLETKGRLPEVPAKYRSADWNKPEIAKIPEVKAQLDLLKYMNKENKERTTLGLTPMGALEAYAAMQADKLDKDTTTTRQEHGEARKKASARVSSSTPAPVGNNVPKGIAVGRGGNLRDLNNNNWGF